MSLRLNCTTITWLCWRGEDVPDLSSTERDLIGLFNEQSDMGDTVTGAALMAGATFAKNVERVQGMRVFARSGYWRQLALHLLDPDELARWVDGPEDRATKYMARWLMEQEGRLPPVLDSWREAGQRLARSKGMATRTHERSGPGRTVAKNERCPCGSGRRARRCHPAGLPAD
ncbi:SEC-C metal-binding domain-containing protein [Nonomuraea sp. NPDC050404]|uniref:SEC-C metal-binding domain-containing protein n=1 Tax=Nonomuraea sp. NPDC050404 TaxID=3155783 RepID=UPI0033FC0944